MAMLVVLLLLLLVLMLLMVTIVMIIASVCMAILENFLLIPRTTLVLAVGKDLGVGFCVAI